MFKNLIILILAFLVWLSYFSKSHSAEQLSQYCDIKTTLIKLNGASKHKTFNTCLEKKNWVYY